MLPDFPLLFGFISLMSGITAGVIGREIGGGGGGGFDEDCLLCDDGFGVSVLYGVSDTPGLDGLENVFFIWVYFGDRYLDEIPLAISLLDNNGPRFLERNNAFN